MTMTNHKMWATLAAALAVGITRYMIDLTPLVAADFAVVLEAVRMAIEAGIVAFAAWVTPNKPK